MTTLPRLGLAGSLLAAMLLPYPGMASAQGQPDKPQFFSLSTGLPGSEARRPDYAGRVTVTCLADPAQQAVHEAAMHGRASNHFLLCRGPVRVSGLVWPADRPAETTACTPLASHQPREGALPAALNFVQWQTLRVEDGRVRCAMWAY